MKKTLFGLVVAATSTLALVSTPAIAEDAKVLKAGLNNTEGAEQRVNMSGKLRMLSQRIPSAVCHLERGVAAEAAGKVLAGATAEFDKILNALEFGDADLNIVGAETDRKIVGKIQDVRAQWEPVKAAAEKMIAGAASASEVDHVMNENMALLGAAKALVIEMVAEYSNPGAMLQSSSMAIDIAGRQRMLTQKMAKESCELASRHKAADTADKLLATKKVFEQSLAALQHGLPAAGITPPPTKEISSGLTVVMTDWKEAKPLLETLVAHGELDASEEAIKFEMLNATMVDMNKVVGMYSKAAKELF